MLERRRSSDNLSALIRRPAWIATALAVLLLAAVQLRVWLHGRALWNDELAIAINLKERGPVDLGRGLKYSQVAPIGWLQVENFLQSLSDSELVLRLPALIAGIALLVGTAAVARRAIGDWAAAAAVLLVGSSPMVVYFSSELKQYAVESAVALGLLLLGADYLHRREQREPLTWRGRAVYAVVLVAALSLSYTALLVLVGVLAVVALRCWWKLVWRDAVGLWLAAVPALVMAAGLVVLRKMQHMISGQETFFTGGMPLEGSGLPGIWKWLPQMWAAFAAKPIGAANAWVLLALVVGGVVALVLRGRVLWALLLASPLVMALAGAAVRGMPMVDRVALYLTAPALLLVVAALDGLVRLVLAAARGLRPGAVRAAVATVVALAVGAGGGWAVGLLPSREAAYEAVRSPIERTQVRALISDVATRVRPGDVVLAYYWLEMPVDWYGPRYGVSVDSYLKLGPSGDPQRCRPVTVDAVLAGGGRVWYLHGNQLTSDVGDYRARVVRELAEHGSITASDPLGWTLFDMSAPPQAASLPEPPASPRWDCLSATPRPAPSAR
ncbi:hypothetical protein QEZ54_06440 [Catellatospora sp. KI3]|uniref:hypothetical protein n=1 Tax=Catellatospora sp. KI3 TaxID=3041620 RepID=UPI002482E1C9|nr:hypothetical protein [Catellatospora sp. KI3]MDI1460598.1 hypothetical protein [Catellatospora sp. KI3]